MTARTPWVVLYTLLIGSFVMNVSTTSVNTAIPLSNRAALAAPVLTAVADALAVNAISLFLNRSMASRSWKTITSA